MNLNRINDEKRQVFLSNELINSKIIQRRIIIQPPKLLRTINIQSYCDSKTKVRIY